MSRKSYFSHKNLTLPEIEKIESHHTDVVASLKYYYETGMTNSLQRFAGYTMKEINSEFKQRLLELERTTVFSLLAAIEAMFKFDYEQRYSDKKKDDFSCQFREIYKEKESKAHFVRDILPLWKNHLDNPSKKWISDLMGAMKYRNWIAHGRYWLFNSDEAKKYDYNSVYRLAQEMQSILSLSCIDQDGARFADSSLNCL